MYCLAEEDIEYTFHYHSLTGGKNWSRWETFKNVDFVSVVSVMAVAIC